jgi:hypothetical protein
MLLFSKRYFLNNHSRKMKGTNKIILKDLSFDLYILYRSQFK